MRFCINSTMIFTWRILKNYVCLPKLLIISRGNKNNKSIGIILLRANVAFNTKKKRETLDWVHKCVFAKPKTILGNVVFVAMNMMINIYFVSQRDRSLKRNSICFRNWKM